jgi:hypothetical protein
MRKESPMLYASRRNIVVSLTVLALMLVIVPLRGGVTAQEGTPTVEAVVTTTAPTPIPTPLPAPVIVFLEAQAMADTLPTGPASISVSTVIISPRVALRAIVTNGPVLILVESGQLTIDADAALIGPPPSGSLSSLQPAATPSPAAVTNFIVPDGNQILLPGDIRVQLRNTTDEETELTIVAIAPEGEEGFGQPAN